MDSIRPTIFMPFRPSSVSDNEIKQLSIYDASGRLQSRFSQEQMASMNLANAAPGAGLKAADINSFAISVASGESLWLQFTYEDRLDGFTCTAIRHRNAKLFLVDDPEDERVKKAAKTMCRRQPGVFTLANEVRSLATRVHSLQSLPSECHDIFFQVIPGIDRDDLILFLASKGFYCQDGSIRCNGCQYRKDPRQFAHLVARELLKKKNAKDESAFSVLASLFSKDIFAGHDKADCFNGGDDTPKTLFRISDSLCGRPLEHGHYSLHHDDCRNHFVYGFDYSVPMTVAEAKKEVEIRIKKNPNASSSIFIDQYLHHGKMSFLFTTTVPKSQFFTQDDLLYETSTIKLQLDTLRDRYAELKGLVDRCSNPVSAKSFHLPRVDSLLSPQIGKVYSKIIVKMAEKEARELPCHDKAGLQRLLDHLLAMIEHSGGAVASKGLPCLAVRPDQQEEHGFLQYSTPQNAPAPSDDSDDLSKIRHQWYNLRSDYATAIISEVLAPLLEIFNPFELNHDVLKKVFGASDAYVASLMPMPAVSLCDGVVPGRTVTGSSRHIDSVPVLRNRMNPDHCPLPAVPLTMGKTKVSDKHMKNE